MVTEENRNEEASKVGQGRWMRRELWFVLLAVVAVLAAVLLSRGVDPRGTASGVPAGGVPNDPSAPTADLPR